MTNLISLITAIWIIAAIIQLYYWLVVVWPLARHKPKARPTSEAVSVIICTNRLTPNLKQLLMDIMSEDYPEFEVIVVNDGPDADVSNLIWELEFQDYNVKMVEFDSSSKQIHGKKEPLAAGISEAKHKWLLLTDSDCTVRRGWIQSMMNCASVKKPIVLGFGPLKARAGLINVISGFDNAMIAMQYMGFALKGWPYMGVGRNLLYHKKIYEKAGGFQNHMDLASGDDDLFVQSVARGDNVALNLDSQSFVYSSAKTTWEEMINQKRRHVSTSNRYKWSLKSRVALTGLSFTVIWLGGVIAVTQLYAVPVTLFTILVVVQWLVFARIAHRLEMRRYIPLFPLWAVLYAVFLSIIGIIALFGRPPKTWNQS